MSEIKAHAACLLRLSPYTTMPVCLACSYLSARMATSFQAPGSCPGQLTWDQGGSSIGGIGSGIYLQLPLSGDAAVPCVIHHFPPFSPSPSCLTRSRYRKQPGKREAKKAPTLLLMSYAPITTSHDMSCSCLYPNPKGRGPLDISSWPILTYLVKVRVFRGVLAWVALIQLIGKYGIRAQLL